MTIFEMLDVLEDRIVSTGMPRQNRKGVLFEGTLTCEMIEGALIKSGLSRQEFETLFGIPSLTYDAWAAGTTPIPMWVHPVIEMLELLSNTARRKLLNRPRKPRSASSQHHPFARIEDL